MSVPKAKQLQYYGETGGLHDSLGAGSETSPDLYLSFAKVDLGRPFRRNRVNAVSNAKRALHLQVELLASALGFDCMPKNLRRNFPQKLDFLVSCGVVAPGILRRVNRTRNAVEHDYQIPTLDVTADFLDVVELFLRSTDRLRKSFPLQLHFGWKSRTSQPCGLPWSFAVQLLPGKGELRFLVPPADSKDRRASLKLLDSKNPSLPVPNPAKRLVVSDGDEYFEWLNALIQRAV